MSPNADPLVATHFKHLYRNSRLSLAVDPCQLFWLFISVVSLLAVRCLVEITTRTADPLFDKRGVAIVWVLGSTSADLVLGDVGRAIGAEHERQLPRATSFNYMHTFLVFLLHAETRRFLIDRRACRHLDSHPVAPGTVREIPPELLVTSLYSLPLQLVLRWEPGASL